MDVNTPFTDILAKQEKLPNIKSPKYVVVIGMGGSILGTKAIYNALYGYFDELQPERYPKAIFVDTTEKALIDILVEFLKSRKEPEEVIINVISKSGTTLETITNLETILDKLPKLKSQLIITTTEGSPLWERAEKEDINKIAMPKEISGRYSVFTSVGLLPLTLLGINVDNLLKGANLVKDKTEDVAQSAATTYLNYTKGNDILDTFFFNPELKSLGEWYEQLIAESLGKEGKGITPITSIGPQDLHSEIQLDLGGPKDKQFTFTYSKEKQGDVNEAVRMATEKAFENKEIPFSEVILNKINEEELGYYMQFKMLETVYLAQLMDVNPYDQPNVEEYKIETKKILDTK